MIVAWIAARLFGRFSPRAASILSWLTLIVATALAVWGGYAALRHSIIARHDAEVRAGAAERQLERVGKADAVDNSLGQKDAAAALNVKEARDEAISKDPNAGTTAVGPVSNATADELRRQRSRQHRGDAPSR